VGITKAYTTRVGSGPFPTEITDGIGDLIRKEGNEYGSSTGRPRRCGWLDLPVLRYSCRINGIDSIAMTKLDVLNSFDKIHICTGYKWKGQTYETIPWETGIYRECEPDYTTLDGWNSSLENIKKFEDLPVKTRNFVSFVEKACDIPVAYISTGPEREKTIIRHSP
jgi:adenylosuccinate synthase